MRIRQYIISLTIFFVFIFQVTASIKADSFVPKEDLSIAALDLCSGKLIWVHKPAKLSHAHFEAYSTGLVAYPAYSGEDKTNPIFLDPQTGIRIPVFNKTDQDLITASATFWPPPEITLENGWSLVEFYPGNTKTLRFATPSQTLLEKNLDAMQNIVSPSGHMSIVDLHAWEIDTQGYPHELAVWKDIVFYAFSYLSDEGILYAFEAGGKNPLWTVDLNSIVTGRENPLTRMAIQVIKDVIYVEANEHIFAFKPETGELIWHRDLADELDLKFHPDFYGGGLNLAVFVQAQDVLVISFERRVVALNLKTGKYLWHLQPDTFPQAPFPIIYDKKVYLSIGDEFELTQFEQDTSITCWDNEKASYEYQPQNPNGKDTIINYGIVSAFIAICGLIIWKKYRSYRNVYKQISH